MWTTDAPYRETKAQLNKWARDGVLAVEMQAPSLFAFGVAKQASVASVAMVNNAVDHAGAQFDTGSREDGLQFSRGSLVQPDLFSPLRDLFNLTQCRLDRITKLPLGSLSRLRVYLREDLGHHMRHTLQL